MILSFYLGIGITIVVGYVKTALRGFGSARETISSSFLFASILMMILTVLALRVVASIPISLAANWIIRITQIRSAPDYQKAVRFSWLALAVLAPVLRHCRLPSGRLSLAPRAGAFQCDALPGNPSG